MPRTRITSGANVQALTKCTHQASWMSAPKTMKKLQSGKVAKPHVVKPATLQPCNPVILPSGRDKPLIGGLRLTQRDRRFQQIADANEPFFVDSATTCSNLRRAERRGSLLKQSAHVRAWWPATAGRRSRQRFDTGVQYHHGEPNRLCEGR